MNIYAKHGDKVIYNCPENGRQYDQDKCKEFLTVGQVYTVEDADVYDSYTDVYLIGFNNTHFKSVMFSDYREVD